MEHDCRGSDWTTKITDAIEAAGQGDTLIVGTQDHRVATLEAKARIRPTLKMSIIVRSTPTAGPQGIEDPPRRRGQR